MCLKTESDQQRSQANSNLTVFPLISNSILVERDTAPVFDQVCYSVGLEFALWIRAFSYLEECSLCVDSEYLPGPSSSPSPQKHPPSSLPSTPCPLHLLSGLRPLACRRSARWQKICLCFFFKMLCVVPTNVINQKLFCTIPSDFSTCDRCITPRSVSGACNIIS